MNKMHLKALVRNIAKEKGISPQLLLQEYVMEHFLERVSVSQYRDNYIVKGGFLVSCLVGLDTRATRDLDATIKNFPVSMETIREMVESILGVDIADEIHFEFVGIKNIREGDDYSGYRVSLKAEIGTMTVPFKLDITTGDKITPREIEYTFESMIERRLIMIKTYNISTLLAEKLETVISRGENNTRMRDYYDIHVLWKLRGDDLNWPEIEEALEATCQKRNTYKIVKSYPQILSSISLDDGMNRKWNSYCLSFEQAEGLEFSEVCGSIKEILEHLSL